MELLQLREKEAFETLNKIKNCRFVLIGGYAVNAYTLPRFSVDCDIVVEGKTAADKITKELKDEKLYVRQVLEGKDMHLFISEQGP